MILNRTGLLELDYDEKDDILRVTWPDLSLSPESEIVHSVKLLTDSVNHYDIKHLLIDSRNSITVLDEPTYIKVLTQLFNEFVGTRLQKIARLASSDPTRENRVQKVTDHLSAAIPIPVKFRDFSNQAEALAWLKE